MTLTQTTALGLLIPLAGTTLGAAMAFFLKGEMKPALQKALLGFASGVMIAASVWSLLIPAMELTAAQGGIEWLPAAAGFLLGIGFLLLLDEITANLDAETEKEVLQALRRVSKNRTVISISHRTSAEMGRIITVS